MDQFVRPIKRKQRSNMKVKKWLIWSIEHNAWWASNSRGYTEIRENAGVYSYEDALKIVESANINENDIPNEAMIAL